MKESFINYSKKLFKDVVGISKIEENQAKLENIIKNSNKSKVETEKDIATAKGEPWVGVLKTHINKEDIRNGFFELDWNDYFIAELRAYGYGEEGDDPEFIVDRWFKELCANVVSEEYEDQDISAGSLDVNNLLKHN